MKIVALSAVTLSLVVIALLAAGSRGDPPTYSVSHGPVRGSLLVQQGAAERERDGSTLVRWVLRSNGRHDWTDPSGFVLVALTASAAMQGSASSRLIADSLPSAGALTRTVYPFARVIMSAHGPPGTRTAQGGRLLPSAWRNVRVKALARGGLSSSTMRR
jgi:hypothetical protein